MNLYSRPNNNIFSNNNNQNVNRSNYTSNSNNQNLPWNNSNNIFSNNNNNNNNLNRSINNNQSNYNKIGTYRATNYTYQKPPSIKLHKQWTQSNYPVSICAHDAFQNISPIQMRIQDYYLIRTGNLQSMHKNLLYEAIQKKRFNENINNSRSMAIPNTLNQSSDQYTYGNQWNNNNNNNNMSNNNIFSNNNNLRGSVIGSYNNNNNNNSYGNSNSNNIFSRNTSSNNIFSNNSNNNNNIYGNNNMNNNSGNNNNIFSSRVTRSQTGVNNIFSNNQSNNNIFNNNSNDMGYNRTSNNIFNNTGNNNIFSNSNNNNNNNNNNIFSNQNNNNNHNIFSNQNSHNIFSNQNSQNIFSNQNNNNNLFSNQNYNQNHNLFNQYNNDNNNNNNIFRNYQSSYNSNNPNIFNTNYQQPNFFPQYSNIPNNNFPTFYPVPEKLYNQLIKSNVNSSIIQNNQKQTALQREKRIQRQLKIRHDSPLYFQQKRRRKSPDCLKIHIIQNNNKGSRSRQPTINIFDQDDDYRQRKAKKTQYYESRRQQISQQRDINIYIKVIIKGGQGTELIEQFNQRRRKPIDKQQLIRQIKNKMINQNYFIYDNPIIQIKNHNLKSAPYSISIQFDDRLIKIPPNYFYSYSSINNNKITDLVIGNQWGKIKWEGITNVQGINFSQILKINENSLQFYQGKKKPQKGQGLNKECVVTFNTCLLATKMRKQGKIDRQKIIRKLKKGCEQKNTQFLSYDEITDVWSLKIRNFEVEQ